MCKCGPVGRGDDETLTSHRSQWIRSGNVSGFVLAHNNYIIQWSVSKGLKPSSPRKLGSTKGMSILSVQP